MFVLDGNPNLADGFFNFRKLRMIYDVLEGLGLEQPLSLDYSHLEKDSMVTQALLSVRISLLAKNVNSQVNRLQFLPQRSSIFVQNRLKL